MKWRKITGLGSISLPSRIYIIQIVSTCLTIFHGGSHAPNHFLCLVITYTHFLLTINLSKNIMIDHFIIICSFALSIIMIICFAPTDHKNKRLSCYQKRKLKKLSIHFCFIITVLFVLFMKNKQSHYISIIWFCIASLSFDLLISVIINKKGGNTHEL
jgi:accessory gene regulator protein AgrB